MSGINGDKSRFHRRRKQKIALRQRNRERLIAEQGTSPRPAVVTPSKAKTL